jgi:hypothetical protein
LERVPGKVQNLMHVVGRGRAIHFRPQHLRDLLLVESVPGSDGEELEQTSGFAEPPPGRLDASSLDGYAKGTKQPDT